MSRRDRRKFTDEQKAQAVKLVRDVGSISHDAAVGADRARPCPATSQMRSWTGSAQVDR